MPAPAFTVILKVVLVLRPPPSVAVSVTLVTPLIEGVPLMNLPDRVRPTGRTLDDRLIWLGVSWSMNVFDKFRLYLDTHRSTLGLDRLIQLGRGIVLPRIRTGCQPVVTKRDRSRTASLSCPAE